MRVAVIGCGGIGRKRAQAVTALGHELIACGDVMHQRAYDLSREYGTEHCYYGTDRSVLGLLDETPDVVIIATPHLFLVPLASVALRNGSHVLIEKPGAMASEQFDCLEQTAAQHSALVRVGFNFRYHEAMREAKRMVDAGAIGEVRRIRGRYGHGARVGYEKEWRCAKRLSGGGAGIDILIHLVELTQWFTAAEFRCSHARAYNEYWQCEVEDNAVMHLENHRCQALLTGSWTEWKNVFAFEIFGETGKIQIDGIGGSYGTETLTVHQMLPQMGPPITTVTQYEGDASWQCEFAEFVADIAAKRQPSCGIPEARKALKLVEELKR